MNVRWLGWAGVELEADGATIVVDPLVDAAGTFSALGDAARQAELPTVHAPAAGRAVAGLVSHLHRDHTDAGALTAALEAGATVHHPAAIEPDGNAALAQAEHELTSAALPRRAVATWETVTAGPFTCTALPAVDGLGDPQVAWLVEAGGRRVLHLGDTVFHGAWWQMFRRAGPFDIVFAPINGAVVDFPHQQPASPLPAAMDPRTGSTRRRTARCRHSRADALGRLCTRSLLSPDPRRALTLRAGRPRPSLPRRPVRPRRATLRRSREAGSCPRTNRAERPGTTDSTPGSRT